PCRTAPPLRPADPRRHRGPRAEPRLRVDLTCCGANTVRSAGQSLVPAAPAQHGECMHLPQPRGAASAAVLETLALAPETSDAGEALGRLDAMMLPSQSDDVLLDDDAQLSLFLLYELHYTGLDGVDDAWEW